MINKKILFSTLSIVISLSLMTGATYAFFTDQATSTANTFSTGNASLLIANDSGSNAPVAYLETIPGFTGNNIFPGYDQDFTFWLRNASSSTIELANVADLVPTSGSEAMQDALSVAFTCTRGDAVVTTAGPFTINQWEAGNASIGTLAAGDGVGNGAGADETQCVMNVTLPTTADNTLAGGSITFDGLFDATQQ